MRKMRLFCATVLMVVMALCLMGCGDTSNPDNTPPSGDNGNPDITPPSGDSGNAKLDITGISFDDAEYTYDGSEKSVTISGALPDGVTVNYEGERGTDAGVYNAKATLTGDGYNTLVLDAVLKINKADIIGISADETQEVKESGEMLLPSYNGELPAGVEVRYLFDGVETSGGIDEVGSYNVNIVISGKNYNTLTLSVDFKISASLGSLANKVIDAFGAVPDAWSLLPESFKAENRAVSSVPDFNNKYVSVSSIPKNGIGKQMNVVYGLLTKLDTALSYLNTVYGGMNVIKELYSNYLDGSPDDYKHFEGSAGVFGFAITVTDDSYVISATVATVEITLSASLADKSYSALVRLNSTTALKYTVSGDDLSIALNILNVSSTLIEFSRDDNGNTVGVFYEYLTVAGKDLVATSAMLTVTEDYTTVIGSKGDFIPTSGGRNCEVYDNESGQLIGTEVREDIKGIVFNTYWFPIHDLTGINSVKKTDTASDYNLYSVYINGYDAKSVQTTRFGGISGKMLSRRYDIEFKTMYFYVYDAESESYKEVSCEIPMIFIQEEKLDDLETDFNKANKDMLTGGGVTLTTDSETLNIIANVYAYLLPEYDKIKEAVTAEDIAKYCNS